MSTKKLVVFCGPSGAGKSTIANTVINTLPYFKLSVSATTRQPREGEVDGQHYYFINREKFETRLEANAFLEYEQVYEGLYYGTLNSELERIWSLGKYPFLDLDVKGAANLKKKYGSNGFFVFIHPGSIDVLADRLKKRGTEDARSLEKRIRRASFELEYAEQFDFVLYNTDLKKAQEEIIEEISRFIEKD